MKNQKGYTVAELLIVVVVLFIIVLGTIGWVKDIVKLCHCDFEAPYKAEAIYSVGAVALPVGAIVGWFDLGR